MKPMDVANQTFTSQPQLVLGQFLGMYTSKKGKVKGLRLHTEAGEQVVKLPKPLRAGLQLELELNMPLRIWAESQKGELIAQVVIPLAPKANVPVFQPSLSVSKATAISTEASKASHSKKRSKKYKKQSQQAIKIQVCRKGSCRKRGSGEICQALEKALQEHPQDDNVAFEAVGCMSYCKQGPVLRVLPDKAVYRKVQAKQIPQILDKHIPDAG